MKKIFTILAIAAISLSAAAQSSKWSTMIDVKWNLAKTSVDGNSTTTSDNFSTAIALGYFFNDNWQINFGCGYSNDALDANIKNTVSPIVGVTFYHELGEKFFWTPSVSAQYGFSSFKDSNTFKGGAFGFNINLLSFEFRPCKDLGIIFRDFSISYMQANVTNKITNQKVKTSNFNWGNSDAFIPTIGFVYYF